MVDAGQIHHFIDETFAQFGVNKRQELSRLLYEIVKRENKDLRSVWRELYSEEETPRFREIKERLLRRRFPRIKNPQRLFSRQFPKLDIDPLLKVDTAVPPRLVPDHFVVEKSVRNSALAARLRAKYPRARFDYTSSYKDFREKSFSIRDYNRRLQTFYIVREDYDFYKKCPCSFKSLFCGYYVINLGSGCGFECAYCYLQDYINTGGIILPANIEDFFSYFDGMKKKNIRLGSGELTDSLIFDHITDYSPLIVEFFKKYPESTFEFKTKSDAVDNLLTVTPGDNIVVSWSMNPPGVIETVEFHTASLERRLDAAVRCMNQGYKLAFHFDPMIHYEGWGKDYQNLVERVFSRIDIKRLAWVSLGTLRMTPRLKKIVENRFPQISILDEELVPGHDGKLRYGFRTRTAMYTKMKDWIRSFVPDVHLYFCMEEKDVCGTCQTAPLKQFVSS